ncbi:MAG: radical SAM protein, partial [Bacillus sp. (in: firmicutes)]
MNALIKNIDHKPKNHNLLQYAAIYKNIEENTKKQIQEYGLPLGKDYDEAKKSTDQLDKLIKQGALFSNNNKSIRSNKRVSSACDACQTGTGSYTSFVSLKCHRDCYFCFNKNQDHYSFHVRNHNNVNGELTKLVQQGVKLTHLALTGGEPLLHAEETISFFQLANVLVPQTHTRLYTAGDLLTEELLQRLKETGLNEIRFSIKLEDSSQKRNHILGKIALAKQYIEDVLVEMPVIPGTGAEMKTLLLELEKLQIFGINLLEFCFPLENAQAFRERGFALKNPPFDVYYNFWYAGGLAVEGSQELCLELVEFALEN